MSRAMRLAVTGGALVALIVAFVALRPGDDDEGKPAPTTVLRPGSVKEIEVNNGERVRLVVRSPKADEVHVHGYDLIKDVPAGGDARFDFRASLEGVFEIELERSEEQVGSLRVVP